MCAREETHTLTKYVHEKTKSRTTTTILTHVLGRVHELLGGRVDGVRHVGQRILVAAAAVAAAAVVDTTSITTAGVVVVVVVAAARLVRHDRAVVLVRRSISISSSIIISSSILRRQLILGAVASPRLRLLLLRPRLVDEIRALLLQRLTELGARLGEEVGARLERRRQRRGERGEVHLCCVDVECVVSFVRERLRVVCRRACGRTRNASSSW
jgi:hypothetical protein